MHFCPAGCFQVSNDYEHLGRSLSHSERLVKSAASAPARMSYPIFRLCVFFRFDGLAHVAWTPGIKLTEAFTETAGKQFFSGQDLQTTPRTGEECCAASTLLPCLDLSRDHQAMRALGQYGSESGRMTRHVLWVEVQHRPVEKFGASMKSTVDLSLIHISEPTRPY